MVIKRLPWLPLVATGAALIALIPQQAQALSIMAFDSLDEMEQDSELIIRGRAISDIEDIETLFLPDDKYQGLVARGEALPLGVAVAVHDEKWQDLGHSYTTLPVEVLTVFKGKTTEKVIFVNQNHGWGATPMIKDAEYLLFISRSSFHKAAQKIYYDAYGQGKYNLDGTDLTTTHQPGYHNVKAVKERYGDRVTFITPSLSKQVGFWLSKKEITPETNWVNRFVINFGQWLEDA